VRRALATVLLVPLAAAGCGGDGKQLTAAQYSAALNTICADLHAKDKQIGQPTSVADLAARGPRLLSALDRAIRKANALQPPNALQGAADRYVALAVQQRDEIATLIEAAKKHKSASVVDGIAAQVNTLDRQSNALALGELHAPACAQSS
jgi:hypothetical protein